MPVELIIDDDRRSAAIDAGTAFVADLRLYSGETRQARDPVRAAHLSPIEEVVVQLAITVDLAALFPCLQEQIGLSLVLIGSAAQRVLQSGVKSTRVTRRRRHIVRTENCKRCKAMNEYFTLHPWRNTRPLPKKNSLQPLRVPARSPWIGRDAGGS